MYFYDYGSYFIFHVFSDASLHFGEPRMPLNSVMSLGQGNPNGEYPQFYFMPDKPYILKLSRYIQYLL